MRKFFKIFFSLVSGILALIYIIKQPEIMIKDYEINQNEYISTSDVTEMNLSLNITNTFEKTFTYKKAYITLNFYCQDKLVDSRNISLDVYNTDKFEIEFSNLYENDSCYYAIKGKVDRIDPVLNSTKTSIDILNGILDLVPFAIPILGVEFIIQGVKNKKPGLWITGTVIVGALVLFLVISFFYS